MSIVPNSLPVQYKALLPSQFLAIVPEGRAGSLLMAVECIVLIQPQIRHRPIIPTSAPGRSLGFVSFHFQVEGWLALLLAVMAFDASAYPSQIAQPCRVRANSDHWDQIPRHLKWRSRAFAP